RVSLGEGFDLVAINDDALFGGRHVAIKGTVVAVELEKVTEGIVIGEVVDCHHFDFVRVVVAQSLEDLPADSTEPVYAYFHYHGAYLLVKSGKARITS